MTEQEKQDLVISLNQLLADTRVFQQKAHAYHWNVTGLLFKELHDQFQEIYEGLQEPIDEIGEQIRILNEYPDVSLQQYVNDSVIEEASNPPPSPVEMIRELHDDNERIINVLRKIEKIAKNVEDGPEMANGEDVLDFAVERHRQHNMFRYKLRSYLEASDQETVE